MSLNHIDYFDARLAAHVSPDAAVIKLHPVRGLLDKINALPLGDHIYLHLIVSNSVEVVKYTHTAVLPSKSIIELPVERGQHGTVITSFPVGGCVVSQITKAVLDEWHTEKHR